MTKQEALDKKLCLRCCAFRKGQCGAITSYGEDVCTWDYEVQRKKQREGEAEK